MDIQRKRTTTRNWLRLGSLTIVAVVCVLVSAVGLSRMKPATPVVQRESVVIGEVLRGTMVRQVEGPGSLVPTDIHWVTALVGGQITAVHVQPGIQVEPATQLIQLRDPPTERRLVEAQRALRQANAELDRLRLRFANQRLDLRWALAEARAAYEDAKERAEAELELANKGFISRRQSERSRNVAERKLGLVRIQGERLDNNNKTVVIEEQQELDQIQRAEDHLEECQIDMQSLMIRAEKKGILQQLGSPNDPLEVGERVAGGAIVAKITDPGSLKAVLEIAETQARDVAIGQRVSVDTRSAVIPGRVVRIDPAVQDGTVTVDVQLGGELPRGARPDLSVYGTIEIERLDDVVYVGRPVFGQPHAKLTLFKLNDQQDAAVRTTVSFGRSSVSTIEVRDGLQEGDRVILSDLSKWDEVAQVSLR